MLKKPRISEKNKSKYHAAKEGDQMKQKGKGKGRRTIGKLSKLVDMPLDIFYEVGTLSSCTCANPKPDEPFQITSKLKPLDILQLSRVSKHFRKTFSSPNARSIWLAVRRNIPALPDCPPDLNEMQYASLLFERNCFVCDHPLLAH